MSDTALVAAMSQAEREHVASWAIKTSRTEELTGQQVMRLAPLATAVRIHVEEALGPVPIRNKPCDVVLEALDESEDWPGHGVIERHASDEFEHARLYAEFATLFMPTDWCQKYAADRKNFARHGFTEMFRKLDEIPLASQPLANRTLVRFATGVFFLDLAGLLTVGVYDESPFESLRRIAVRVHADEGRHVAFGLDLLRNARNVVHADTIRDATEEFLPLIDAFLGGDESPVQKTLAKAGIRRVSNADLKAKLRAKIAAQLALDEPERD